MEIILTNNISTTAAGTALTIEGLVGQLTASGMSKSAIKQTLLSDLQAGGAIFGSFKNQLGAHTANGIERAGLFSTLQTYKDKGVEVLQWVTISDKNSCQDCIDRHGEEGTLKYWQAVGLPMSGFSVCGANCRCEFVASGYKGENLDKPLTKKARVLPPPKKRIKKVPQYEKGGFLDILVGEESKKIGTKTITQSNKLKDQLKKAIDQLKLEADKLLVTRQSWRTRVYKKNNTEITVGDASNPFAKTSKVSVSALNEKRRIRTIKNIDNEIINLRTWIDHYEDMLDNTDNFLSSIYDELNGITSSIKQDITASGFEFAKMGTMNDRMPRFQGKFKDTYVPRLPENYKTEMILGRDI